MKQALTSLLLAACALLMPGYLQAQDVGKWTISIELKNATLVEAFSKIESLTPFRFNYKTSDISEIKNITYPQRNVTVKKVLTDLLANTPLRYEQVENYIVIKSKKETSKRSVTLYGFVTAVNSGESLIGATVNLTGVRSYSTVTNAYGFYSLTIPIGEYSFAVSFVGYQDYEKPLRLQETIRYNIEMAVHETNLQSVTIASEGRKDMVQRVVTGSHKLGMETIRKIAMPGGEPDILKSLQFLPGIQASAEGTTNLSVRGGSFDQNLILLDEATVYNPSHTLGFVSAFNPDALKDVAVYKGVFPAQYGGRLSSVIDIRMKEGNSKEREVSGGIGLLTSRLTFESPIKKGKSSIMISGRYSYIGLLMNMGYKLGVIDAQTTKNKVSFYDFNAKYNVQLGSKDKLYLSAYTGHDNFFLVLIDNSNLLKWGNTTVTARWNHMFSPHLFSNSSILYSNYEYSNRNLTAGQDFLWRANLKEVTGKTDFDWNISANSLLKFGAGVVGQQVLPGKIMPGKEGGATKQITLNDRRSWQFFAYVNNEQKIARGFHISYGIRAVEFIAMGHGWNYQYNEDTTAVVDSVYFPHNKAMQSYFSLEPRVTARLILSKSASFKISYGRNYQFQHLLSNSSVGLPTDIWIPSDNYFKPQYSDHFVSGLYKSFASGTWEAAMEVYYRTSNRIIDFRDNAQLFLNDKIETQILPGQARSYGLEFMLQKNKGRQRGWVSYTYSKSMRLVEGVNENKWYPASYDHRHNFSAVFNQPVTQRIELSLNWVYRSGGYTTIPEGSFIYSGVRFLYYSERNAYQLPAYHRLDMGITWKEKLRPKRKWSGEWVFSVYNVYNRQNVFAVYVTQVPSNYSATKATKVYLGGVLPSLTYNFKF